MKTALLLFFYNQVFQCSGRKTFFWSIQSQIFFFFFTEAGIDEDAFRILNDSMLDRLFSSIECGFQQKFAKRFELWKNDREAHDDSYKHQQDVNNILSQQSHLSPATTESTESNETAFGNSQSTSIVLDICMGYLILSITRIIIL